LEKEQTDPHGLVQTNGVKMNKETQITGSPIMDQVLNDFQKVHAAASTKAMSEPNYFKELGLHIYFDFEPYEAPITDLAKNCGPGRDASVSINRIEFRGIDITSKFTLAEMYDIETEIMETLEEEIG